VHILVGKVVTAVNLAIGWRHLKSLISLEEILEGGNISYCQTSNHCCTIFELPHVATKGHLPVDTNNMFGMTTTHKTPHISPPKWMEPGLEVEGASYRVAGYRKLLGPRRWRPIPPPTLKEV
jgi:hypothetical protein